MNIISQTSNNFNVLFICSDGDPGTNEWHLNCFRLVLEYLELDLSEIIKFLEFKQWPISDFLHIIKNQRCRLLHGLSLTPFSEIISLDNFFLYIPSKSFSDKTVLSKFNDKLALLTFSVKNIQILMNLSKDSHLYYLLPFALWEVVLLSKNLSLFSRKRLLEITKFIFANEYKFLSLNSNKQFSEKFTKNATRISFYSKEKLRRILNTIIGLYFSLE